MVSIEELWERFYEEKKLGIHTLYASDTIAKEFAKYVRKYDKVKTRDDEQLKESSHKEDFWDRLGGVMKNEM